MMTSLLWRHLWLPEHSD